MNIIEFAQDVRKRLPQQPKFKRSRIEFAQAVKKQNPRFSKLSDETLIARLFEEFPQYRDMIEAPLPQQPKSRKLSRVEFAQAVKRKYPQYSGFSDEALVTRLIKIYPGLRLEVEARKPGVILGTPKLTRDNDVLDLLFYDTRINISELIPEFLKVIWGIMLAPFSLLIIIPVYPIVFIVKRRQYFKKKYLQFCNYLFRDDAAEAVNQQSMEKKVEPTPVKPVNHDNMITQFRNWYRWRKDKEKQKYTIKQRRIITTIKRASWLLALSAYCISFLLREMTPVPAYRISPRNVMTTPDYSIEIAIIVFIIVRMSIWVLKGFWVTDAKE